MTNGAETRSPPGQVNAVLINGMLVPDPDSVRSMLYTLHQRMRNDPALAERYRSNPGEVLGEIGICQDLRNEVLRAEGIEVPEGAFCTITCIISVIL